MLRAAALTPYEGDEIDCPITFADAGVATRAFLGAGPMAFALRQSGEELISQAVRDAVRPFTSDDGRVTLPSWYRVVLAR